MKITRINHSMKNPLLYLFALLCAATLAAHAQSGNLENGIAWEINEGALTIKKTGEGTGEMTDYSVVMEGMTNSGSIIRQEAKLWKVGTY